MVFGFFVNPANSHQIANEMGPYMAFTPEIAKATVGMFCDENDVKMKEMRKGSMLSDESCVHLNNGDH